MYVLWSTVVDAPLTMTMTRDQAIATYGLDRIERADENGTSIVDGYPAGYTPEEIVAGNRAGPDEKTLSVAEIIAAYDPNNPGDWL